MRARCPVAHPRAACVPLKLARRAHCGVQVTNTCRRAVTIVSAAIVFQNVISAATGAGIALIIGGSAAYVCASAAANRPAAPAIAPNAAEADALLEVVEVDEAKSDSETKADTDR